MNEVITENQIIVDEMESTAPSIFDPGTTAYSIVAKLEHVIRTSIDNLKSYLTEHLDVLALKSDIKDAKDEVLEAISKINTYEVLDKDDWDEITGEEPEPEPEQNVVAFMCMAAPHYEDQYKCTYGGEIQYEGRTWYLWTVDPTYHTPEVHFTLMRNPKAGDPCYEGNPIEDPNNEREILEVYYE